MKRQLRNPKEYQLSQNSEKCIVHSYSTNLEFLRWHELLGKQTCMSFVNAH